MTGTKKPRKQTLNVDYITALEDEICTTQQRRVPLSTMLHNAGHLHLVSMRLLMKDQFEQMCCLNQKYAYEHSTRFKFLSHYFS